MAGKECNYYAQDGGLHKASSAVRPSGGPLLQSGIIIGSIISEDYGKLEDCSEAVNKDD